RVQTRRSHAGSSRHDHFAEGSRSNFRKTNTVRAFNPGGFFMRHSLVWTVPASLLTTFVVFACSGGSSDDGNTEEIGTVQSEARGVCGDHRCNHGETCSTCSQDCGSCGTGGSGTGGAQGSGGSGTGGAQGSGGSGTGGAQGSGGSGTGGAQGSGGSG